MENESLNQEYINRAYKVFDFLKNALAYSKDKGRQIEEAKEEIVKAYSLIEEYREELEESGITPSENHKIRLGLLEKQIKKVDKITGKRYNKYAKSL